MLGVKLGKRYDYVGAAEPLRITQVSGSHKTTHNRHHRLRVKQSVAARAGATLVYIAGDCEWVVKDDKL